MLPVTDPARIRLFTGTLTSEKGVMWEYENKVLIKVVGKSVKYPQLFQFFWLRIHTEKPVELRMAVETIYTAIEKIMLTKEGSFSVYTGTRISENHSMDESGSGSVRTNPCNDCRAGY